MPAGQDCTGTKTKTKLLVFTLSLPPFTEYSTHGTVQKLTTFFKNVIFEKLESQFTIIKYADIVN